MIWVIESIAELTFCKSFIWDEPMIVCAEAAAIRGAGAPVICPPPTALTKSATCWIAVAVSFPVFGSNACVVSSNAAVAICAASANDAP